MQTSCGHNIDILHVVLVHYISTELYCLCYCDIALCNNGNILLYQPLISSNQAIIAYNWLVAWHSGKNVSLARWPTNFLFRTLDLQLLDDHLCGKTVRWSTQPFILSRSIIE